MRLIDADKLRDIYSSVPNGVYTTRHIITAIDECKTIDAALVKHGKWLPVLNGKDDDSNPAFDCSECDAMCRKQYNYCPRCGAKMDLEE